jgi:D-alanyl-D-alanine carboxypeptidase
MLQRRDLLTGLTGLGLLGAAAAGHAATPAVEPDDGLEALLKETGAPAVAGVVGSKDGVIHTAFAGVRRIGASDRVTATDLWHIGSNTKAMTAALYGRLVQQGKARWDAKLPALFPGQKLDPAWNDITIRQVMGHRAGLRDAPVINVSWLVSARADSRPLTAQRADLIGRLLAAPPAAPPGEFSYGNINYILAGAAIERITGQGWEQAIASLLFEPLKMTTAGFGAPKGDNPWGHRPSAAGLIPMNPAGVADNPPALGPAGTVHLSLADHAKFARLFLVGGAGVLDASTLAALTTPVPGPGQPYALGWGVSADRPWAKGPVLAHEGSNTFWHEVALIAPGRGLAILTACNAGPEASKGAARTLAQRLRQRFAPD